jgi:glycerol-3-phosphate acyltransferase PlsX
MTSQPITIAVDAMGGDYAPEVVLEGVTAALAADLALHVLLVGPPEIVVAYAASHERVEAVAASDVIGMDEHPANAVRGKPDSSIVVGCRLVKEGRAQGFLSAGNSGAVMAGATLVMGRIKGVSRPAIAAVLPTTGTPVVLLDVGANADCKPEYLLQFARMGAAYARAVLGVQEPRVALLSNGEEDAKGSLLVLEAHGLMRAGLPGFVGNVEGRDIPFGTVDVVVTDGFTGNVVLKLMEGLSKALLGQFKSAMLSSPVNKVAAAVLRPSLQSMRDRLDPETHGAAPLLGVNGLALIAHGTSGPRALASALRVGAQAVRGGLVERIAEAMADQTPGM